MSDELIRPVKKLVYIAGPYAKPDPVVNVRRAVEVADALVAGGYAVIVPHLSMLWHLVSPAPPEAWYSRDLDVLAHADILVRFPGESPGADEEVAEAKRLGIPVWSWAEAEQTLKAAAS
jgi:hypothetical protein